jgi:asparagine synthase (glutamine-hydrolysing)
VCGIAGIFAYHYPALPVDRDELRQVRDHMAARGPDGRGEWFSDDGRVGLGHRRLSIIDLSDRAAQPMKSGYGKVVVSFNGEIYNFRDLRRGLEARGKVFRTELDTEVLLHLYAEKGEAMLGDLRGMFALALWDGRKDSLLLARDPYGIKPLYLADDGWTVRFASQVKALLTSPRVSRVAEPAGLAGFYLSGSVPEPFTLYQEIRSVPAGSYQWVDSTGPRPPVPYFSLAAAWAEGSQGHRDSPAEIQEAVRAAVLDSVRHHLVADVPVGAFLSAGIDSGALAGLMKDAGQEDVQAVTLAFEEYEGTSDDEAPLAADVARAYGLRHTVRVVGEREFREDLPKILAAMDQPSTDGVNAWFVSKAAHEAGLKVAVSGLGGDELFGGYPSFRSVPRWARMLRLPAHVPGTGALLEQLHAAFAPLFPSIHPKTAGLFRHGGSFAGAWLLQRGLFLPGELGAVLGDELAREGLRRLRPLERLEESWSLRAGGSGARGRAKLTSFARVAALEASFYMRNQLLRDTDWASMAHSLEVRVPLVDATLLSRLAGPLQACATDDRKSLLARSPTVPLPDRVARRPKTGFTTPVGEWQIRSEGTQAWRGVPVLAREPCPWARRWCHVVATSPIATGRG